MEPRIIPISLDLIRKLATPRIELVQGDAVAYKFVINITEDKQPIDLTGCTSTLTFTKSDSNVVIGNATVTDTNTIEYLLGTDEISFPGYVQAQVQIYDSNSRISTGIFGFIVNEELNSGSGIISETNYSVLTSLMNEENTHISNENIRKSNENARNIYEPYNSSKSYVINNKVIVDGSSYINILPCSGIKPPNDIYWRVIAAKGDKGDRGTQGSALTIPKTEYTVSSDGLTNIPLNFTSFNPLDDNLEVNYNGITLDDVTEYTLSGDNLSINLVGWSANSGDKFVFRIYKQSMDFNTADGSLLIDKSINAAKLSDDIQEKLSEVPGLVSDMDYIEKLTKPYNAYKESVFGQEHLSAFHKKIMTHTAASSNLKIDWIGDSTTYGVNVDAPYTLDKLFGMMVQREGLNYIDNINNGVSGSTTAWWSDGDSAYVTTRDIPLAPNLAIIRYGINDANAAINTSAYEYYLRQGLTKFRAAFPVNTMSIVLMTPTALDSSDTVQYPGKTPEWNKAVDQIVRQAAIDFNCCFVDTYALWQDATNSSDFMMDDKVHLSNVFDLWIASKLFDVIFPKALIVKHGIPKVSHPTLQNGWTNFGNGYQAVGYYIDKSNIFHLHGVITGGTKTKNTTILTLPSDMRPYSAKIFNVASASIAGDYVPGCIFIQADGIVQFINGDNGWLSFDGISFLISDEYTM